MNRLRQFFTRKKNGVKPQEVREPVAAPPKKAVSFNQSSVREFYHNTEPSEIAMRPTYSVNTANNSKNTRGRPPRLPKRNVRRDPVFEKEANLNYLTAKAERHLGINRGYSPRTEEEAIERAMENQEAYREAVREGFGKAPRSARTRRGSRKTRRSREAARSARARRNRRSRH